MIASTSDRPPTCVPVPEALLPPPAQRQSLAGRWTRLIAGEVIDEVLVPSSFPPMGACELRRAVSVAAVTRGRRRFLCGEGVLSSAEFLINGQSVGRAGAWSPYRIEIPHGLLTPESTILVRLTDICETYGPTPGRRFDAGIIRELWLEERPETCIADVHWQTELSAGHDQADCQVTVTLDTPGGAPAQAVPSDAAAPTITVRLYGPDGVGLVYQGHALAQAPHRFTVAHPRLWSPQDPQCYRLEVSLGAEESVQEVVGFRSLCARGPDLWLNGERLLLSGVCRHEFMEGHGYAPPEAAVRAELQAIRRAGFNYVRLVHSPHARAVARLASEIGLLVSEEPGTCFHDLSDPDLARPALAALERLVLRDRNLPAVLAWFIYNECLPNVAYAVAAAAICRAKDPGRLTSFADCSGRHLEILAMVQAAGLSFVGLNIYSITPNDYRRPMDTFAQTPLVYTEWGAGIWSNNHDGLESLCRMFIQHGRLGELRRISGFSYWCWADYEEYSREEPCAVDGWTIQGLVDRNGVPKSEFRQVSQLAVALPRGVRSPPAPVLTPLLREHPVERGWRTIELQATAYEASCDEALSSSRRRYGYQAPSAPALTTLGIPFTPRRGPGSGLAPLLLGPGQELTLPVAGLVREIAVLGHVTFLAGYPCSSIHSVHHADAEPARGYGELAGEYVLECEDGDEVIPLRHGIELLRANAICRWWKLQPRSVRTQCAWQAVIHPSYEILRIDLWRYRLERPRTLRGIRWRAHDAQAVQAMVAMSVLTAIP